MEDRKAPAIALLSMEQQFTLRKYATQIKTVTREELEDLFLEVMRQKMAQENLFRDLMRTGEGSFPRMSLGNISRRLDEGCEGK